MEVGIRIDLRVDELFIFRSRGGSITLGSGIWKREGGGECVGVILKADRGNSVSEK